MHKRSLVKLEILIFGTPVILYDLIRLVGQAGIEVLRLRNTEWKKWLMRYVPEKVSAWSILGVYSLLSIKGLSGSRIRQHKTHNLDAWNQYKDKSCHETYIEKQFQMTDIRYGSHTGDYNACEVIAVYNALQFLTDGDVQELFPDLLERFEKRGIAAKGAFGTSMESMFSYLVEQGYDARLLVGKGITEAAMDMLSGEYTTYIMTAYNDRMDLEAMIHTVSITVEDGKYVIHNDYEGNRGYASLAAAVFGYHNGTRKPIILIGVRS